jgi:hypothetical protein
MIDIASYLLVIVLAVHLTNLCGCAKADMQSVASACIGTYNM